MFGVAKMRSIRGWVAVRAVFSAADACCTSKLALPSCCTSSHVSRLVSFLSTSARSYTSSRRVDMGRVELILGPMFSGKSSELLRRLQRYEAVGAKSVLFNHVRDEERLELLADREFAQDESVVSTHDGHTRSAYSVATLKPFYDSSSANTKEIWEFVKARIAEANVIAIDEGQFFPDIREAVMAFAEQQHKHVIVAGLDGTFKREKFGSLLDVVPIADSVDVLHSLCMRCKDGTPARFSSRKAKSEELIQIGGRDKYEALCRYHFLRACTEEAK
uniref:Thymidine kinase n=1 Tax=Palpitomonas bilix TaxID=652834 RepID=A0A7S3GHP2_9EUKA|mmetsp:Transcript_50019/g.128729  ORF Transcript_50019/g.128729 Transcript_50019/m.128729 type:complete len:275 (+) Transcript_50019:317-1141(+)